MGEQLGLSENVVYLFDPCKLRRKSQALNKIWFLQDRATTHSVIVVMDYLRRNFCGSQAVSSLEMLTMLGLQRCPDIFVTFSFGDIVYTECTQQELREAIIVLI